MKSIEKFTQRDSKRSELKASSAIESPFFEIQIIDERLLTKKEIANFLNVSIKMIDRKVHMNEIPYLKIGRLVRFSKKSVLAWAEETTLKG
jgi:excisionase family DNA binding protein